jgi:hypothetical protein
VFLDLVNLLNNNSETTALRKVDSASVFGSGWGGGGGDIKPYLLGCVVELDLNQASGAKSKEQFYVL